MGRALLLVVATLGLTACYDPVIVSVAKDCSCVLAVREWESGNRWHVGNGQCFGECKALRAPGGTR